MRQVAANRQLLILGGATAVPSDPSFVPEIGIHPADSSKPAPSDGRPAFQLQTLKAREGLRLRAARSNPAFPRHSVFANSTGFHRHLLGRGEKRWN
jgi:hypothetical protein